MACPPLRVSLCVPSFCCEVPGDDGLRGMAMLLGRHDGLTRLSFGRGRAPWHWPKVRCEPPPGLRKLRHGGDVIRPPLPGERDKLLEFLPLAPKFVAEGATQCEILVEQGLKRTHRAPAGHGVAIRRRDSMSTLA